LCGGAEAGLISSRARDGSSLNSVVCFGCGLLRSDPMPAVSELRRFYQSGYRMSYKGVREPKPKHVARAGHLAAARLRELSRYIRPPDRVLDIGSGAGEWLYLLKRQGISATGLDPDPGYAAFARRELSVEVVAGLVDEVEFAPQSFQVVTLFHVLEHLRDPVRVLKQCLGWLSDGGNLIVEVPNLASPHQHPHKRFHPAHLFGFVPATLALAARKAGGYPLEVRTGPFSRNITAVITKSETPATAAMPSPADLAGVLASVKPRTLLGYHASPATCYRFGLRMLQYAREQREVWRGPRPRQILDAIMPHVPGDL
jgi:SAM-dependent methyltransferase